MRIIKRMSKIAGLAAIVAALSIGCDKEKNGGEEDNSNEDDNSGYSDNNGNGYSDNNNNYGNDNSCSGVECHDRWSSDESIVIPRGNEFDACYDESCIDIDMTDPELEDMLNSSDVQAYPSCPAHDCMNNHGTNSYYPYGISVQVYVITKNNVSAVSDERISSDFEMLNQSFQPMGLSFIEPNGSPGMRPIKYLDAPQWWNLDINSEFDDLINSVPQGPTDGWPMIYVRQINSGSYAGAARLCNSEGIVLAAANGLDQSILSDIASEAAAHEFGHQFCLYHTHEAGCGQEACDKSNCSTSGDFVCDTPADRFGGNCYSSSGDACYKICDDCNPDASNFMSYWRGCQDNFSEEQFQIMTCWLVDTFGY